MPIYIPETEGIYFKKTREYFEEVLSSYANGNYRSAIVMLYSVAICDMLLKLKELQDMFNDTVATEILQEVEKSRSAHDNKSKSKWEKEFVDNVFRRTKLLDNESYINLNHLFDHRNFSAHPALNDNYDLIAPSKETTIAHIRNILFSILVKPPIFIKNITEALTEDLKGKSQIYKNEHDKLAVYLNNKYFSKMTIAQKLTTIQAFWKFCFLMPDNSDCKENLGINRQALEILIECSYRDFIDYVKSNSYKFSVASEDLCVFNLIILVSIFPELYLYLDENCKLEIEARVGKDSNAKALSWFKYSTAAEHFAYLEKISAIRIDLQAIKRMVKHYTTVGEISKLFDYFIYYFGESANYDSADERFEYCIEPYLHLFTKEQVVNLLKNIDDNRQIHARGAAYSTNGVILKTCHNLLGDEFDYSQYSHLKFDKKIIEKEPVDKSLAFDEDLPF